MADWSGTARSNYFAVEDSEKFKGWADACGLRVLSNVVSPQLFAIFPPDTGDGGWPMTRFVGDEGFECEEFELIPELAEHLHPDAVAVLAEVGAEKHRYLTGRIVAVTRAGVVQHLDLMDIYDNLPDGVGLPER